MLILTLFRHAKSSWDFPELADFDRPLAARGEEAAPRIGAFLAERSLMPNLVLCSTAKRTRQTIALALPALKPRTKVKYLDGLYHAGIAEMLAIVGEQPPKPRHIVIVGHNPGLQSLALHLIGEGDSKDRRAIARKFPTAAVAVIAFDAQSWGDLNPGAGQLVAYATAKQLARKA
ncbi:MAG: histidine phosphatase family protein [Rhodomicrobium sp.]|nr:histidine phosphatase family protein [Rhodomicrobium sp.]